MTKEPSDSTEPPARQVFSETDEFSHIPELDGSLEASTSDLDMRAIVGKEIRFWRNERGLTGAKAAKEAGISAGMLSKIEKGQVAPSIQTLVQIAEALSVPISMLFYRLQKSRYVSFVPAGKGLRVEASGTRANHVTELLSHNLGHSLGIEPFLVRIDETSKTYSLFQEEGFKFVYMLEGEVIYRHGSRDFHLRPGDSLTFDAMSPHGPSKHVTLPAIMMSILFYSRFDRGLR